MLLVRTQPELDQRARIRRRLRLPAIICLIFLHRLLACGVPFSRRLARQIVLANQRLLNLCSALGIDLLLPTLARSA